MEHKSHPKAGWAAAPANSTEIKIFITQGLRREHTASQFKINGTQSARRRAHGQNEDSNQQDLWAGEQEERASANPLYRQALAIPGKMTAHRKQTLRTRAETQVCQTQLCTRFSFPNAWLWQFPCITSMGDCRRKFLRQLRPKELPVNN